MDAHKIIANQTDVALLVSNRLMSVEAKDVNFVFSPPSIYVMLSLAAAGSNGKTLDELLLFLKSNKNELNYLAAHLGEVVLADASSDGGPKISLVNGAWVDHSMPFKKEFRNVAESVYKATIKHVDFRNKPAEVVQKVNSWALQETNGLIKDLLAPDSVNQRTSVILANAIHFKGVWTNKFNTAATKVGDFHLRNGTSVKVPLMTSWEDQFVAEFDGFKVLQLPYSYRQHEGKRKFSMSIFLPDTTDGLPALAEKICSWSGFINKHIPKRKVSVGNFRIPKFKISYDINVSKVLKDLGLTLPFKFTHGFTEMVDFPLGVDDLCISGIFHKSFIEVNEEGTEAAAATGLVCVANCIRHEIDFVADHPFIFAIRENVSGAVLFVGHIVNPLEG